MPSPFTGRSELAPIRQRLAMAVFNHGEWRRIKARYLFHLGARLAKLGQRREIRAVDDCAASVGSRYPIVQVGALFALDRNLELRLSQVIGDRLHALLICRSALVSSALNVGQTYRRPADRSRRSRRRLICDSSSSNIRKVRNSAPSSFTPAASTARFSVVRRRVSRVNSFVGL